MTPLLGPDQRPYALAQGSLVVGGHRFDSQLNSNQRNYPTAGTVAGGATVESPVDAPAWWDPAASSSSCCATLISAPPSGSPTASTASSVPAAARMRGADSIVITAADAPDVSVLIARIESVTVQPLPPGRIVINERTGTIVAGDDGADLQRGDLAGRHPRLRDRAERGLAARRLSPASPTTSQSLIVTNTTLDVEEPSAMRWSAFPNTTVGDLVQALSAGAGRYAAHRSASCRRCKRRARFMPKSSFNRRMTLADSITGLIMASLDGLSARQAATAENIANARLAGLPSVARHLRAGAHERGRAWRDGDPGRAPRIEGAPLGETVRIDLELATASATASRYAALADLLNRRMQIEAIAVTGNQ